MIDSCRFTSGHVSLYLPLAARRPEAYGARHLDRSGFPARLVALVAHHSGARFEAAERGLLGDLDPYPLEDSP